MVPEFEEIRVIKEELGQNKVRAVIDFLLQVLPIDLPSPFAGHMAFRESGHPDGKAIQLPDQLDQLIGKLEPPLGLFKLTRPGRRITPQCQDILASQTPDLSDD